MLYRKKEVWDPDPVIRCRALRGGEGANSATHFLGKPDTSAAGLCQRTPPVRPMGRACDGFLESPTMPRLMADSEHGSIGSWAVRLSRPHSGLVLIHPIRNWCYLDHLNYAKTPSQGSFVTAGQMRFRLSKISRIS